ISSPLMAALGQKRTWRHHGAMSALPPKADSRRLGRSALCHKPTFAVQADITLSASAIRGTGFMEDLPGLPDQSALTPANFTTLPHFSVSSTMSLPKSLGEPVSAMPPRSASRAFILGSATPASISLLSLSMILTGVLLGAPTPNQPLAS